MIDRLRFATALTMGLLACGGRVGGESPLSEGPPGATPQTRGGGERSGRGGSRPPPSFNGEDRPQLPRAPMVGESAPAGEASSGAPAPFLEPASPSDLDCAPGASRCNGARLEQCSAEAGWFLVAECAAAALCDPTQGTCQFGCLPGEARCNGAALEQCNAEATGFELIAQCASPALCRAEGEVATCASGCTPGEIRCNGTQVQRCNDDRTRYDVVEQCLVACELGRCVGTDVGVVPGADAGVVPGADAVDPEVNAGADPGEVPSEDPGAAASDPSTDPAVPSTDPGAVPGADPAVPSTDPGAVPGADPAVPSPDPVVPSADAGVDVAAE